MDFTRILDFILQSISKQQIIDLLARLSINGASDFEVFTLWVLLSLIIDLVILFVLFKFLKTSIRFLTERIGY